MLDGVRWTVREARVDWATGNRECGREREPGGGRSGHELDFSRASRRGPYRRRSRRGVRAGAKTSRSPCHRGRARRGRSRRVRAQVG